MTLHKEYVEHNGQTIRFTVAYDKANGRYRVTAVPCKRTELRPGLFIEEIGAFTGFNDTLLQVERQSAKRLKTAINELNMRKEKYLAYFDNPA